MTGIRPFSMASPNHPIALCIYGGLAAAGGAHVLDLSLTPSMLRIMSPFLVQAWGLGLLVSAMVCLVAALLASRPRKDPDRALLAEGLSSVTLALLVATYEWATFHYRGLDPQFVIGQLIYVGVAVGALSRFVQIDLELMRLKRARATLVLADPPPIGDPTTMQ